MATSLAAQLAVIAANSKTSLNVKAQKASHSKSLIFEPKVAAGQSFQTLYNICTDGFQELCRLDPRFVTFSQTLFSEQSQDEDRSQMTAAENAELDKQTEAFLRLVGSRLRLMPAIKAIEWLIRRFRIHEFNTATLLTTFLPYHTIPAFVTLLSILPAKLPHVYRFLDPYVRSLQAPPRAAIVQHCIQHFELLSVISTNTLRSCRELSHYPALVAFWGGVMTEVVNGLLDKLRSGRKAIQKENDQRILQQVAPILGEALVMDEVPGLQIASYIVVTVLALKADLEDAAITAFMEQLVKGWTEETLKPGLVCLSFLCQSRAAKHLPRSVAKALLGIPKLSDLLGGLQQSYRIDRLANGIVLSAIERLAKKGNARGLSLVQAILDGNMLQEKQVRSAIKSLLAAAQKLDAEKNAEGSARQGLGALLARLSQSKGTTGEVFQRLSEEASVNVEEIELKLDITLQRKQLLESNGEDTAMTNGLSLTAPVVSFDEMVTSLPSSPSTDDLVPVFKKAAADQADLSKFDQLPCLHRGKATTDAFYLSFCKHIWLTPQPSLAKARALGLAKNRIKESDAAAVDFQLLLPSVIAALSDPARSVRQAAGDIIAVLAAHEQGAPAKQSIWSSDKKTAKTHLEANHRGHLFKDILLPSLEASVIDAEHSSAALGKALESDSSGLSSKSRAAIFTFLAARVLASKSLREQTRILKALNHVKKISGTSRTHLLLPIWTAWAALSQPEANDKAYDEGLDVGSADEIMVAVMTANDTDGLKALFETLERNPPTDRAHLVTIIFGRLKSMWSNMKEANRGNVAVHALELALRDDTHANASQIAEEATDFLRNIPLDTQILIQFLKSLQNTTQSITESQSSSKRRRIITEHAIDAPQNSAKVEAALQRVTFILELVAASDPTKHPQLLQGLFAMLSELQSLRSPVGSEMGYLQNLVLSSLTAMMSTYEKDRSLKIDTGVGHGDILVSCIQKSSSPAVQNQALLLVASLAKTAPDAILHSVMPIFTFMGGLVLRQSDEYSAHVVNQTIREVIPPLIGSFRKRKQNLVASAAELLSSFVIAYEHVPSHRRLDLLVSLTQNLGPADFLFAIEAMLVDKYGVSADILSFCADLANAFDGITQLQSLLQYVELSANVLKPKPSLAVTLFGELKEADAVERTAQKLLALLPRLLMVRSLKREVKNLGGNEDAMEASQIRELYAQLLEDVLGLSETVKANNTLFARCGEALSTLLNLLSIYEFVKAVETLLDRPNVILRQKVLQALESRVDNEKVNNADSRNALLAFVPQLTAVVRDSDDIHYKHTAVACIDKIAEKYGKKDLEVVAAAAGTIAGKHCLGHEDRRLRVMAMLCLASLAEVLRDGITTVLPIAMPTTLIYLDNALERDAVDAEVHDACYTLLSALVQQVPYMISGAYLDQILASSSVSAAAQLPEESHKTARQCLRLLAKRLDAQVIFTALRTTWSSALDSGLLAITDFVNTLEAAVDKHTKAAISKNTSSLSAILFDLLDLRRHVHLTDVESLDDIDLIEANINSVALKIIYKLNDASFRPIFAKLIDWSSTSSSTTSHIPKSELPSIAIRQQSVYNFLATFFQDLKSIVTSYATYIIEPSSRILTSSDLKNPSQRATWVNVLETLKACFEHDQDSFWQTPSHYDGIAPALVSYILRAPTAMSDIQTYLLPTIVSLAALLDSKDQQKALNTAILKHCRSETASIRLAAVKCEQALVEKLGAEGEWLDMLPEMLPYVGELQEDDDEEVERETARWIVMMEGILGESLDAMLQ